jgi:hypothetical protein
MKNILACILILSTFSFSACKKDKADCEENNYGILSVSYGLSSYRHSIIVSNSAAYFDRDKITALGINSDTLHLAPGTYSISISSINADGLAIDTQNGSSTITQCDKSSTSVTF